MTLTPAIEHIHSKSAGKIQAIGCLGTSPLNPTLGEFVKHPQIHSRKFSNAVAVIITMILFQIPSQVF